MNHNRRINWPLTAGFSLSLLAHAMIALAMGSNVFPTASAAPPPRPQLERPEITPGVDNSHTTTINWIGFEEPTPHQARLAATDQPALDRGPDAPPSPKLSPSAPAPLVEIVALVPTPPTTEPAPTPNPSDPSKTPNGPPDQIKPTPLSKTTLTRPAEEASQKKPVEPAEAATKPASKPSPQPAVKPAPPQPPSKKGGAKRESPPTSQTKPIEIKPGQPIAMQGLQIDTVAPKFTTFTSLTANPRNPLVKLTFNTAGKVIHAEVLESSGYESVDRPVKDALYNWRAHGVQLAALKKKDPKQKFSLQFRIVLQ